MRLKEKLLRTRKKKKESSREINQCAFLLMFFSMKTEQDVKHREIGTLQPQQDLKNLVLTYASFGAQMPNLEIHRLLPTSSAFIYLPEQLSWAKVMTNRNWIISCPSIASPMLLSILIMLGPGRLASISKSK